MDEQHDPSAWIIRCGGHLFGSLGLALLAGALLTAVAPSLIGAFPWEAGLGDQFASVMCGAGLMAAGGAMLATAGRSPASSDDELG